MRIRICPLLLIVTLGLCAQCEAGLMTVVRQSDFDSFGDATLDGIVFSPAGTPPPITIGVDPVTGEATLQNARARAAFAPVDAFCNFDLQSVSQLNGGVLTMEIGLGGVTSIVATVSDSQATLSSFVGGAETVLGTALANPGSGLFDSTLQLQGATNTIAFAVGGNTLISANNPHATDTIIFGSLSEETGGGVLRADSVLMQTGGQTLAAVPEPSSLALVGLGVGAIAWRCWRRRR